MPGFKNDRLRNNEDEGKKSEGLGCHRIQKDNSLSVKIWHRTDLLQASGLLLRRLVHWAPIGIDNNVFGHLNCPAVGCGFRPPTSNNAGGIIKWRLDGSSETLAKTDDAPDHAATHRSDTHPHGRADHRTWMLSIGGRDIIWI